MNERVSPNADTLRKRNPRSRDAPAAALVVVASPDASRLWRRYALDGRTTRFGRADTPQIIDDPRLSKAHFELDLSNRSGAIVRDLGTTNGTFVDGLQATRPTPLGPHAVVSAGDTLFVVDTPPAPHDLPAAASETGEVVRSLVGLSECATRIRRSIETVADGDEPVLLLGETGVGKEVAARAIHELSGREGPCVSVNCAAIPGALADSMLFGHAKGAFTSAHEDSSGFFTRANGGTLFLDEIGELPPPVQAKLLRVLETGIVEPLGGEPMHVDVRIVAATHQSVEDERGFRADLHARLSDWTLRIPPLRERRADILPLFSHFAAERGGADIPYTSDFAEALLIYDWPQNVREVAKLAMRLVRLCAEGDEFDSSMLPARIADRVLNRRLGDAESTAALMEPDDRVSEAAPTRQELLAMVEAERGNVQAIARANNWHRMQIYRWAKRYGIDLADYR